MVLEREWDPCGISRGKEKKRILQGGGNLGRSCFLQAAKGESMQTENQKSTWRKGESGVVAGNKTESR